jgi:8-oxo-dGTP diphosphatase
MQRMRQPLVSVDLAVFTLAGDALQALLVRRPGGEDPFPGAWALPGGFVDVAADADLGACAVRKLREKARLAAPYMEQLGSWGGAERDPRGWSTTHAYFALVPPEPAPQPGGNASEARWFPVTGQGVRPKLAFDHAEILAAALARLRAKIEYTSLPAFALPREFTLGELQRAYEIMLGRTLEKSAFRTRILGVDLVEPAAGKTRRGPNRPAQVYRLCNPRKPVLFARTFGAR